MATQWYYAQNNQQFGPIPAEQLRSMLSTGALRPSDLVWSESLPAWTPAGQVSALQVAPNPPAPAPVYAPQPAPKPSPNYAPAAPSPVYHHPGEVSEEVVGILKSTKPWVRFLSVLGFLGLALLVVGCIAILAVPMGQMGSMTLGPRIAASFAYLLMGLLQLPAVLFLSRYASRIARLATSGDPNDLEDALRAQKSFWKYVGILTLVMMILYLIAIVGVLVFAGAAIFGR
ncbi:MAG: DUF4339 domain-containing protein [Holophagaceae bacterium]|nr:DUF4339 domain-containing protein [Holophagaceae bacterium]